MKTLFTYFKYIITSIKIIFTFYKYYFTHIK